MIRVKYSAVIGLKKHSPKIGFWHIQKTRFSANHSDAFNPYHQTTDFRKRQCKLRWLAPPKHNVQGLDSKMMAFDLQVSVMGYTQSPELPRDSPEISPSRPTRDAFCR